MKNIAASLLLITTLFSAVSFSQQNPGEEKLLVLPSFGYSDEQGLGLGANAAWVNIGGSSWAADATLYDSTLYNQNFFRLEAENRRLYDIFYFQAGGFVNRSTRSLFYGVGNSTDLNNETQYALVDSYFYARFGVRVYDDIIVGVGYSHRSTGIDRGSDPAIAQFLDVFPNYPRRTGTTTTSTNFFAAYDTRTPIYAPQSGNFAYVALEQTQPRSGEDLSQQRLVIEGENYYDVLDDKSLILVSRLLHTREWGEDVPFFLQESVGGVDTLRGFRMNRYIDAGATVLNVEPRYTFWQPGGDFFKRFEASLALELGAVFNDGNIPPPSGYHTDWDFGITAILAGDIPLRLDYAVSPESTLIYLHLLYPF